MLTMLTCVNNVSVNNVNVNLTYRYTSIRRHLTDHRKEKADMSRMAIDRLCPGAHQESWKSLLHTDMTDDFREKLHWTKLVVSGLW